MIGSIVGAGLSAAGSIYGGIKAAREARKMQKAVQQQQRENTDWYNRRYNEDATQRADAQRLLTMTEDAIKRRNEAVAGTQAVMGGTDAALADTKEKNAAALADTASRIEASAEARKDNIESNYLSRKQALDNQLQGLRAQKTAAIGQAVQGLTSAAGSIGGAIDDERDLNKQLKAQEEHDDKMLLAAALGRM